MKKWLKRAFWFLLVIMGSYLIYQHEMVVYGIRQGVGQVKILRDAKPIEVVLADTAFPDSLKQKIHFIQKVRAYAVEELGLVDSDNYTTLYNQKGQPILWVVSACPPYSLKEHQWDYPFLGKLGYKGYFKEELAQEEAERLENKGFDVSVGTVSAWSTLGFFSDPILSNMLNRDKGDLAELIIHELTHATLYVKGDATFNENLATFIGKRGAEQFLADTYGKNNEVLNRYLHWEADKDTYAAFLVEQTQQLKQVYEPFEENEKNDSLDRIKTNAIRAIFEKAKDLPLKQKERFYFINHPDTLPNNTYFTGYAMYREQQSDLDAIFQKEHNRDIESFIAAMKAKYGDGGVNR